MNQKDLNDILFCSFRYALGRRTYIVSEICRILIENKSELSPITRLKIIDEIHRALETNNAGMDCDEKNWREVSEKLSEKEKQKSACECGDKYHANGAICLNQRVENE